MLPSVRKSFRGRNPEGRSFDTTENNFVAAVNAAISCLPNLTSRQFQLSFEIVCLGILSCADNCEALQAKDTELQEMIGSLVDIIPQVEVHFSHGMFLI